MASNPHPNPTTNRARRRGPRPAVKPLRALAMKFAIAARVVVSVIVVVSVVVLVPGGGAGATTAGPCQSLAIPSTAATPNLSQLLGVAVDGSGNIYAADFGTDTVLRFDSAGVQTLAIPATAAMPNLSALEGVAVDGSGNIYAVDSSTATVFRFDSAGLQTLAIPATAAMPNLVSPVAVAVDASGSNIYVADVDTDTVYRFDSAGAQTLAIPGTAAMPNLDLPASVAVDVVGNIYVADALTETVYKFNSAGNQTFAIPGTAAIPNLDFPSGVAVDVVGNIYVTDFDTTTVHRFDGAGAQTLAIPKTAATPNFSTPGGVAVDGAGNIYVVGFNTPTVYRFGFVFESLLVANEAEYRAALACASGDAGGPHVIELTADIDLDDGSNPAYTGTADLTVDGNGHTMDAAGTSNILTTTSFITTVVRDITMSNGTTATAGGAVDAMGPVMVSGATFTDNTAAIGGAVFSFSGASVVTDSSFVGNSASTAGGFRAGGSVTVSNSTFFDTGGDGQSITAVGDVTLAHVTLSGTTVAASSSVVESSGGNLTSTASVFTDPAGSGVNCDIAGTVTSGGHNWSDDASCGFAGVGDTQDVGGDPLLGPARDNGSPPTRFPLNGSPLIDAVPAVSCSALPELDLDERGVDRPFGSGCDIGAIESVFPAHGFGDVSPFYESTVRWVTSTVNTPQILLGFDANTFGHQLNITRGQAARLYYRAAGAPSVGALPPHGFSDVSAFFEDAVRWAKSEGLFNGYPDNSFRQNNPIIRGDYTRSLYNFAGAPPVGALPPHGFPDISPFYEDAVRWIKGHGLANGFPDNTYRLANNIIRGDASRTAYNTAQTPTAWNTPGTAPANMLFRPNTP